MHRAPHAKLTGSSDAGDRRRGCAPTFLLCWAVASRSAIERIKHHLLDPWRAQNQLLDAYSALTQSGALTEELKESFAPLADKLNMDRGLLGWQP